MTGQPLQERLRKVCGAGLAAAKREVIGEPDRPRENNHAHRRIGDDSPHGNRACRQRGRGGSAPKRQSSRREDARGDALAGRGGRCPRQLARGAAAVRRALCRRVFSVGGGTVQPSARRVAFCATWLGAADLGRHSGSAHADPMGNHGGSPRRRGLDRSGVRSISDASRALLGARERDRGRGRRRAPLELARPDTTTPRGDHPPSRRAVRGRLGGSVCAPRGHTDRLSTRRDRFGKP